MMKKVILSLAISLASVAMYGQSAINVNGQDRIVDTLEHKQIGPGVIYTKARIPSIPLNFYTLSVDLDNEYNKIETFQAQNSTGKTEAMTKAYSRLSTDTQETLAGINGNFWIVSSQGLDPRITGVPHSGSVNNGAMITDPNDWNRGHGAIGFAIVDENRKVWIDDMDFDGKVTISGVGDFSISQINRIRGENQLVFFNDFTTATRTEDNGVEVFIKPVDGQSWRVNNAVECEVIDIIKDKGGNAIPQGQSVLSGVGTARTFLENLSVGSKVTVNMGVYTIKDQLRPLVTQMITGNALVMKDGILTDRNTNESYNSTLYPRTGIGVDSSGKKATMIVIDKRGQSVGASTGTMCEILKASGSVDATSLDGGGSAQMMLEGKIINNPADGSERAVSNGWMLFSTAPQSDKDIAEIKFLDYQVKVPKYASYNPTILAYNKYGALINDNLEGFKLSCDDALGSISSDGSTFVASGGKGLLHAEYNGVKVSKQVEVIEGEIVMRLDSVILDDNVKYEIEVYSKVGENVYFYDPASIDWEIKDETICSITEGVLEGLKIGETSVKGTLGEFTDSIKVKVQIPDQHSILIDEDYSTGWTLGGSSAVTNREVVKTETGFKYNFAYKKGRYPYADMKKSLLLYALPDSLHLTINSNLLLSSAVIYFSAINSLVANSFTLSEIEPGVDYEVKIPFAEFLDLTDISIYPIKLTTLSFNIDNKAVNQDECTIEVKDFSLIYSGIDPISIDEETLENGLLQIYPNPVVDGYLNVNIGDIDTSSINIAIYGISGQLLKKETIQNNNTPVSIDVKDLTGGIYLIDVEYNGIKRKAKFIVK